MDPKTWRGVVIGMSIEPPRASKTPMRATPPTAADAVGENFKVFNREHKLDYFESFFSGLWESNPQAHDSDSGENVESVGGDIPDRLPSGGGRVIPETVAWATHGDSHPLLEGQLPSCNKEEKRIKTSKAGQNSQRADCFMPIMVKQFAQAMLRD